MCSAAAQATSPCCTPGVGVSAVPHVTSAVDLKRCGSMRRRSTHCAGAFLHCIACGEGCVRPLLSWQPRSRSCLPDLLHCCPCSRCAGVIDAEAQRLLRKRGPQPLRDVPHTCARPLPCLWGWLCVYDGAQQLGLRAQSTRLGTRATAVARSGVSCAARPCDRVRSCEWPCACCLGRHACLRVCVCACLCACCVLLCARVCAAAVAVAVCAVPSVPCCQSVRAYECCACVGSVLRACARACVLTVLLLLRVKIGSSYQLAVTKISGPPALGPLAL